MILTAVIIDFTPIRAKLTDNQTLDSSNVFAIFYDAKNPAGVASLDCLTNP